MSVQAITWALEQTVGSPTGKVILLCLANYADKQGACFPGHKTIADECEVSVRSVAEWMAKLEALGLIARSRRFRNNGSRTSDSIILRLPWLAPTTSSEPSAEFAHGTQTAADGASPHADDRVDHVQQVHPHTRQNNQISPQPPLAGGRSFAELSEEWPMSHRGNPVNAAGAFDRLSVDDQGRAIRLAKVAVSAFARRRERIPALVRYIRQRMFDEFDDAPEVDSDGHFVIKPGRPEWGEWLGWIRRTYGEKYVERTVMAGVFLPKTRWPAKAISEQSSSGAVH